MLKETKFKLFHVKLKVIFFKYRFFYSYSLKYIKANKELDSVIEMSEDDSEVSIIINVNFNHYNIENFYILASK